jgi:hypothetical protein
MGGNGKSSAGVTMLFAITHVLKSKKQGDAS